MCFAPQRRLIFHLSSAQRAPHPPLVKWQRHGRLKYWNLCLGCHRELWGDRRQNVQSVLYPTGPALPAPAGGRALCSGTASRTSRLLCNLWDLRRDCRWSESFAVMFIAGLRQPTVIAMSILSEVWLLNFLRFLAYYNDIYFNPHNMPLLLGYVAPINENCLHHPYPFSWNRTAKWEMCWWQDVIVCCNALLRAGLEVQSPIYEDHMMRDVRVVRSRNHASSPGVWLRFMKYILAQYVSWVTTFIQYARKQATKHTSKHTSKQKTVRYWVNNQKMFLKK